MADLEQLADALWGAYGTREPIRQPSTSSHPDLTADEAYSVQRMNIDRRLAAGEIVVGHKIGLTSLAMQQQLGVDQPDFGVITDSMVVHDGGVIDGALLIAPRLEAEFAFRIAKPLAVGPSLGELRDAIGDVAVAIEVIDSRVADWKIGLVDTIADNASSSGIVVGPWRPATAQLLDEIISTTIDLRRDGRIVATGPGSAVLGDPVVALHWLATAIARHGQTFAPGDVVLAGAVAASLPLEPGVTWSAAAEGFETVTVTSAGPSGTR